MRPPIVKRLCEMQMTLEQSALIVQTNFMDFHITSYMTSIKKPVLNIFTLKKTRISEFSV